MTEIPENIEKTVDCQGMVCPKPQLLIKKALNEMSDGQVGEMLITNPASVGAVQNVITKDGSTVLGEVKDGALFKVYFKK